MDALSRKEAAHDLKPFITSSGSGALKSSGILNRLASFPIIRLGFSSVNFVSRATGFPGLAMMIFSPSYDAVFTKSSNLSLTENKIGVYT